MQRSVLYSLLSRWGGWARSLESHGIKGIAIFMSANSGGKGIKSSDLLYNFPDEDIKIVHEAVEYLDQNDRALIIAHFKNQTSLAKIGSLINRSKSWTQKEINKIICKIDDYLQNN